MLNLSLSGCGFLGIYHIGVISAVKEHAAEILQEKISGCSAGALVAACAACDCCLGQMVSDTLEIALKARSHALGPLHPSFNIVEILKNGLRRILPVDAHRICSGKVHISLTRWRDGKNFLVNQFDSREELIQALICSTFIPCYSGFIPPKFKGTYFWDGGLSNNNPILNQDTIIVSPFGGEADICPRDESGSFFCYDFQGTNLQLSNENIYRISKALFPPNPEVLKAICFRGYKDGIHFLKSRNLLQCSCSRFREKTSISSMFGEHLNGFSMYDLNLFANDDENESMYDSEEENLIQYAQSTQNEPLAYQEMPVSVCEILDAACNDNKGLINYVYDSQVSRAISIMFLPWTLPIEFSLSFTKRVLELVPKMNVPSNPSNFIDTLIIFLNYVIQKLTYDRYHYHARVVCKLCLPRNGANPTGCRHNAISNINSNAALANSLAISKNPHGTTVNEEHLSEMSNHFSAHLNYPKICARHRVPSLCSSETGVASGSAASLPYRFRRRKNNRSLTSNASDLASSVDLNEYKSSKLVARRQKYNSFGLSEADANSGGKEAHKSKAKTDSDFRKSLKSLGDGSQLTDKINILFNAHHNQSYHGHHHHHHHHHHHGSSTTGAEKVKSVRVHFHLNHEADDKPEQPEKNAKTSAAAKKLDECEEAMTTTPTTTTSQQGKSDSGDSLMATNYLPSKSPLDDTNNNLMPIEWESYWDNLEYNALGRVNLDI